jgi:hypothetical protein
MPKCPNCEEFVKAGWSHCPECGSNIKEGHYSTEDDPIEKLTNRVNKMDEFLTDKFKEDDNANPDPDPNDPEPRRKKAVAKKKRRTLFGD